MKLNKPKYTLSLSIEVKMFDEQKIKKNIKKRERLAQDYWEDVKKGMEERAYLHAIALDDTICRDDGESTDYDSYIKYVNY